MNNKNMSATSNNKGGLLETLPPIVPSIGFTTTKGQKNPAADNDTDKNDNDTKETSNDIMLTTEETSQPTTTNTKKLPPSIKLGNRLILTSKTPRQWSWSSFTSSARKDTATFHHWKVRVSTV